MKTDTLNILLVEDNLSTALDLEMKITEMGHTVLATVDRADAALPYINEPNLDIAIIDVGLNGSVDGIEVAEHFYSATIPVVFSTGRQDMDTFERAQKLKPLAYLVKPFDKLTLHGCLEQVLRLRKEEKETILKNSDAPKELDIKDFHQDSFFVRNKGALHKIKFSDISYIQSDRNYSILNVLGKKYAAKISLNNLIRKLPYHKFIRIHQSYILCFDAIERININEETVTFHNGELPLGKTYKSALLKRINKI